MNGLLKEKGRRAIESFTAEECELIAFYERRTRKARGAEKNVKNRLCFTVMREKGKTGFLPPEKTAALKRKNLVYASERLAGKAFLGDAVCGAVFGNDYLASARDGCRGKTGKVFEDNSACGSFFGNAKKIAKAADCRGQSALNEFSTERELWEREKFYRAILSACNPL